MPPPGGRPGTLDAGVVDSLIRYVRALNDSNSPAASPSRDYGSLGQGAAFYLNHCAQCHGFDGRGSAHVARALNVDPSSLDLTTAPPQTRSLEDFRRLLSRGTGKMLPLSRLPDPQELDGLIRYIQELASLASSAPESTDPVDTPPRSLLAAQDDAFAVVIGAGKSSLPEIPPARGADNDARVMRDYLIKAMGYRERNVLLLVDDKATRASAIKAVGGWLKNRADKKSRVFFYFSGHGSRDPVSGNDMLDLYDTDPGYLSQTALSLQRLFGLLRDIPAQDKSVVLDACFLAGPRAIAMAGLRPLKSGNSARPPVDALVMTATGPNQVGAGEVSSNHGLFTYYLLSGLHGAAASPKDGSITVDRLYAYVKASVEKAARRRNIEQTPLLYAPPDQPAAHRPWVILAR